MRLLVGRMRGWRATDLEVLCNFADEALEGELADEQLGRLLIATDFTKGNGTRPEAMGLLDTACCSDGLSRKVKFCLKAKQGRTYGLTSSLVGSLCSELLARRLTCKVSDEKIKGVGEGRSLTTGGLAGGLLRTGH